MRIVLLLFMVAVLFLIIVSKSNLRSIILLSVFSTIGALMYYLYQAPDVAMAELAVGAAVVPLIFLISVTRQKKYVVEDNTTDKFMSPGQPGHQLLREFCQLHELDLVVMDDKATERSFLFTKKDIDLLVYNDAGTIPHTGSIICSISPTLQQYMFQGGRSSFLFQEFIEMLELERECPWAQIVYREEEDIIAD